MKAKLLFIAGFSFVLFAGCPLTCGSLEAWCASSGKCDCSTGTCCVTEAGLCQDNTDCCAGMECTSGACRPAGCLRSGSSCTSLSDCCSLECNSGSCGCSAQFRKCYTNADCCSGMSCIAGFCG